MIHTTVKMHGQLDTWSSRHTVNSPQRRYTWLSTRHTILGDFRAWRIDCLTSWLESCYLIGWWVALSIFMRKFTRLRCTIVQSAVLKLHVSSVCLSVMLVDHDHRSWKSWKLIAWTISPTSSLFVAQRSFTYSHGNVEKCWGENVRSTPTSITSGSTESHVILGGGVATGCLLLSLHRTVIYVIAKLSSL